VPGGLAIELAAPALPTLERLRAMKPLLNDAVQRAGLRVVRWSFAQSLAPAGDAHAFLAATDVTSVLTLPVFRAVAELALSLPLDA
jgi:hypothetical protein